MKYDVKFFLEYEDGSIDTLIFSDVTDFEMYSLLACLDSIADKYKVKNNNIRLARIFYTVHSK